VKPSWTLTTLQPVDGKPTNYYLPLSTPGELKRIDHQVIQRIGSEDEMDNLPVNQSEMADFRGSVRDVCDGLNPNFSLN
jgi:hypothetical protein